MSLSGGTWLTTCPISQYRPSVISAASTIRASGLDQFKDFVVPLFVLKVDSLCAQGMMYFTGLSDRQHGAYVTEYIR